MENNHEYDFIIKSELSYVANGVKNSEDSLKDIFIETDRRRLEKGKLHVRFSKYIAVACIACVVLATPFIVSANVRAMAIDVINSVKMVFVMDNNNEIVERPANEVKIMPAVNKVTLLSDKELSKKIGIEVCIPNTLNGDYNLDRKLELVAFNKKLSYDTFDEILYTANEAINSEEAFQSLKEYAPYRSVGCIYKDNKEKPIAITVFPPNWHMSIEYMDITENLQTKVGKADAQWIGISYPDYDGGDMTQKPIGKKSCHILLWSTKDASYLINTMGNQPLSMDECVKIAEAFMKAQK